VICPAFVPLPVNPGAGEGMRGKEKKKLWSFPAARITSPFVGPVPHVFLHRKRKGRGGEKGEKKKMMTAGRYRRGPGAGVAWSTCRGGKGGGERKEKCLLFLLPYILNFDQRKKEKEGEERGEKSPRPASTLIFGLLKSRRKGRKESPPSSCPLIFVSAAVAPFLGRPRTRKWVGPWPLPGWPSCPPEKPQKRRGGKSDPTPQPPNHRFLSFCYWWGGERHGGKKGGGGSASAPGGRASIYFFSWRVGFPRA